MSFLFSNWLPFHFSLKSPLTHLIFTLILSLPPFPSTTCHVSPPFPNSITFNHPPRTSFVSDLENTPEVMFGNFQIHPSFCTQVVSNADPLNNNNTPKTNSNGRALAADRKRPYPCNLCTSKFGSKMELEEHQNSHTGQKPFECDKCQSRFNRRSTLWNHKRIHSDAKPFVCTVCQMTFKWKNSLKVSSCSFLLIALTTNSSQKVSLFAK